MLLGRLKRLFRRPPALGQQEAFAALNALAPREETLPRTGEDPLAPHTLICREAILERTQKIAGYQFRLRGSVSKRIRSSGGQVARLYDRVVLDHLLGLGVERLLGGRFALVEIDASSLHEGALDQLPLKQLIVLLVADAPPDAAALARLQSLRSRGMRLACGHIEVLTPPWRDLLPLLDLFVLDLTNHGEQVLSLLSPLFNACPEIQMLARGLEVYDQFEACHRWQQQQFYIHYFQGDFVTRREEWTQPNIESNRMAILQLLNQLRQGAELRDLALSLRQDSVLSYKLLRYVNSAAGGLATPAASIEHAVVVLGRDKLARWLGVLLFSVSESSLRDLALLDTALIRGRLMELLLEERGSRTEQEQAFLTGLFSLLDRLLRMPMAEVAQQLQLPPAVEQALLQGRGQLAPWLAVVEDLEADAPALEDKAAALGLPLLELNRRHLEAMLWAQEAQA